MEDTLLGTLSISEAKNIFATKEDFKTSATKEDLKLFATKKDLESFATKEDLKTFATKDDLSKFGVVQDKLVIIAIEHGIAIKDLQARVTRIEPMVESIHGSMDTIMVILKKIDHEQAMFFSRFKRIEDRQDEVETKVKKLEATLYPA